MRNAAAIQISRFLVPIFTRFILDFGGQNIYALVQLLMCALGTSTVWRTVTLVWRRGAKDDQEASKSSNTEPVQNTSKGKECTQCT